MRKKLFLLLIPLLMFVMTACKPVLPLSYYEEWLGSLDGADVAEISVESGYIGVAPGTETTIHITEDREEIERLVSAWKGVTLAVDISAPTGGGTFQEITFTMENGTTYTVYSGNGKYTVEGLRFTLSAFPTIAEDKITRVESGESS